MIKQNMLRYTIPFCISAQSLKKKNIFSALRAAKWKKEHIVQGENDLYNYITDLVNDNVVNDVASSWKLEKEMYTQERYITKLDEKDFFWSIAEVGLVLFSTGVGILWYEIDPKKINEFDHAMNLAYSLKELARGSRENNYVQFSETVKGEDDIRIAELESDINVQITNKISTPQGLVIKGIKKINLFNDVFRNYLSGMEVESYFANRVHDEKICPDRAIPFSWVYEILESGNTDVLDKAFHLGRAYKSSYDMSTQIKEEDFYMPFEDSIWYSSLEGCANYTSPNVEKSFYTAGYATRLNTYFYLYILCLGQYYSLLKLAHEVSSLPVDESKYSSKDNRLEVLLDKIHVFNLKNNYSQVSHLTQHNEFYEYLQNRLGINKMQEELEVELQALFEMIERKKTIKQEKNNRVLTIIGGIFVVLQAFINVAAMYNSVIVRDWGYFAFATIGCLGLTVLGVIIWLLGRINK